MKNCIKCSHELSDNAKFCEKCGAPQFVAEQAADTTDYTDPAKTDIDTDNISEEEKPDAVADNAPNEFSESNKNKLKHVLKKVGKPFLLRIIDFVKKNPKKIIAIVIAVAIVVGLVVFYDASHCDYGSCKNSSVSGSDYCYNHKCNICDSQKFYVSNYCYYHYLIYDDDAKSSYGSASTDLRFSNISIQHNSSYTVVTGTVTNNGSRTYKFVTIKGSMKTSTGTVVDTDSTYAVGSEGLAPGESTKFRMSVDKNYSISKCDISIIDYD